MGLVWIGFVVFFVAALWVGIRLLLLWRRTGEWPELLIGIGVLGIGIVGFGLQTAGAVAGEGTLASRILLALSLLGSGFGTGSYYFFNWVVYHRPSRSIWTLAVVGSAGLLVCFLASWVENGFGELGGNGPIMLTRYVLMVGGLLWGSGEAFRYWLMMRRRLALGLADPVVTNRFLLWSIGAGAAGLGSAIGMVVQVGTGLTMLELPWLMMSSSVHGFVAAVALWLAFVPPAAYVRHVRARVS
jgi:hypothetical protein